MDKAEQVMCDLIGLTPGELEAVIRMACSLMTNDGYGVVRELLDDISDSLPEDEDEP